jgi:K+/H+ antiporter YhaU regulatory subunit KhtT
MMAAPSNTDDLAEREAALVGLLTDIAELTSEAKQQVTDLNLKAMAVQNDLNSVRRKIAVGGQVTAVAA